MINGTTTITTYTVTDTFSFESGSIDGIDDGSSSEDWKIPDGWKDKSGNVTTDDETTDGGGGSTNNEETDGSNAETNDESAATSGSDDPETTPGDTEAPEDEDDSGARYTSTATSHGDNNNNNADHTSRWQYRDNKYDQLRFVQFLHVHGQRLIQQDGL